MLASAGSADKLRWLTTLGVDAGVNYRTQSLTDFLAAQCPEGLDCYFDNVGGPALDAALVAMKPFGRIALSGAIARYNDADYRGGPKDFFILTEKSLSITGFNFFHAMTRSGRDIPGELRSLLKAGALVSRETIVTGLDNVPAAFAALFRGENFGKMLVRLS